MNEKQKVRYNEIRVSIIRVTKEIKTGYVKNNRDIHLMKLEEAIELWREKARIKPLHWTDAEGLKFLEKQAEALRKAQASGWDRATYKKAVRDNKAHENLSKGMQLNPKDFA